jgi:hypothetical protein
MGGAPYEIRERVYPHRTQGRQHDLLAEARPHLWFVPIAAVNSFSELFR